MALAYVIDIQEYNNEISRQRDDNKDFYNAWSEKMCPKIDQNYDVTHLYYHFDPVQVWLLKDVYTRNIFSK